MRLVVLAIALVVAPLAAAAEPTLTEAQAIGAARAWVRAAQAGNAGTLAKLSTLPLPVDIQMEGCKLDKTVSKAELARHTACLKKSIGKVKWRDDRWKGALKDGAWQVEQTLGDEGLWHITLAIIAGHVVRVQASFSFGGQ